MIGDADALVTQGHVREKLVKFADCQRPEYQSYNPASTGGIVGGAIRFPNCLIFNGRRPADHPEAWQRLQTWRGNLDLAGAVSIRLAHRDPVLLKTAYDQLMQAYDAWRTKHPDLITVK